MVLTHRSNPFAAPILPLVQGAFRHLRVMDAKSVFVLMECWKNKNEDAELYQVSQPNGGELIVNPVRSFGDCGKHGDQGKGRHSWIFPPRRVLISDWFKGKLYMLLPVWERDLGTGTSTKWLSVGRTFDPHHKLTGEFKAPNSLEPWGALISAYDNLYYLVQPKMHGLLSSPFQCYYPGSDTWKDLPSIPPDLRHNLRDTVAGYAVCSGHILVSISDRLLAYDVHDKKWHCVSKHRWFYGISGRAVVLGDYIYAVDSMSDLVCEFTFDRTDYAVKAHVVLEGLATFACDFKSDSNMAYLGNDKFLFVKCGIRVDKCQSLFITVFSIVGEPGSRSIKTLAKHVYDAEYTRHTNVIFFPKSVFTLDCPCSESEGEDPMAQRDACGRRSTGGQISETETDAKGLEGGGKGHSSGGGGRGKWHSSGGGGRGNGNSSGGGGRGNGNSSGGGGRGNGNSSGGGGRGNGNSRGGRGKWHSSGGGGRGNGNSSGGGGRGNGNSRGNSRGGKRNGVSLS